MKPLYSLYTLEIFIMRNTSLLITSFIGESVIPGIRQIFRNSFSEFALHISMTAGATECEVAGLSAESSVMLVCAESCFFSSFLCLCFIPAGKKQAGAIKIHCSACVGRAQYVSCALVCFAQIVRELFVLCHSIPFLRFYPYPLGYLGAFAVGCGRFRYDRAGTIVRSAPGLQPAFPHYAPQRGRALHSLVIFFLPNTLNSILHSFGQSFVCLEHCGAISVLIPQVRYKIKVFDSR